MLQLLAGTAKTAEPIATQSHSFFDYLQALAGIAVPLTAFIILLTILIVIFAVAFRWVELDLGFGKVIAKLRRPIETDLHSNLSGPVGVVEDVPDKSVDIAPTEVELALPEPASSEIDKRAEENQPSDYFTANSVDDLDANWPILRASLGDDDPEFWETNYLRRRANFGADHGRDAVLKLAQSNPSWAYPFAIAINWSLEDGDFDAAEKHLATGLGRHTSPHFGGLLAAGVKLRMKTGGKQAALSFCLEWSNSSLGESVKYTLLIELAESLKEIGDTEGYRVAYEWALNANPTMKDKAFRLAYNYGDDSTHWMFSMATYEWTISNADHGGVSRNNFGVVLGSLDKKLQIESYELAVANGDDFATANLARLLIDDGYITAGERLLATIEGTDNVAELHASALTTAHAARRNLKEKHDEITNLISSQVEPVRSAIANSFRHFKSGAARCSGYFTSEDSNIQLILGDNEAKCEILIGKIKYTGNLKWEGTCYSGDIRSEGTGLIGTNIKITVIEEDERTIQIVRWPAYVGIDQKLLINKLQFTDTQPQPIQAPQPPLENSGINSLLIGQFGKSLTGGPA